MYPATAELRRRGEWDAQEHRFDHKAISQHQTMRTKTIQRVSNGLFTVSSIELAGMMANNYSQQPHGRLSWTGATTWINRIAGWVDCLACAIWTWKIQMVNKKIIQTTRCSIDHHISLFGRKRDAEEGDAMRDREFELINKSVFLCFGRRKIK